jgi:hypothetical protein
MEEFGIFFLKKMSETYHLSLPLASFRFVWEIEGIFFKHLGNLMLGNLKAFFFDNLTCIP